VVTALLGTFLALNFLSAVEAVNPGAAARFMLITVFLAVFALWLTGFLNSVRRARLIVRAYLVGALAAALLTSLALYTPLPGGNLLLAYSGTRGEGLFQDPNVYGPFLIPAALIVLEELLTPRLLRARKGTKVVMFCILLVGVLFSYSRAAWVCCGVSIVVLLATLALRRGGGRRAGSALAVVIAGAIAVAAALAVTGSLGFLQERAHLQSYDVQRFGAQESGFRLAEQHPFGIGPGQFDVLLPISTHSIYVRTLSEQGILGFASILGLLLATLVLAGRNAVLGRDTYGIGSATLLAAWSGLLINSFVVDTLHWRHLFLVAALIWIGAKRPPSELTTRLPGSRR
jgi:O-antigen ligase